MFSAQWVLSADGGFIIMDAAFPVLGARLLLEKGAGLGLFLCARDDPRLICFRLSVTSDFVNPFQNVVSSGPFPDRHILGGYLIMVIQEPTAMSALPADKPLHVGFNAYAGLTCIWIDVRSRPCSKNPGTGAG